RTSGPVWAAPVGAALERPPAGPVAQIDRAFGRLEHQRCRLQHVRQRAGIVLGVRGDFRKGHIGAGVDELAKLTVGDGRAIHPKPIDTDAMSWRLFWIMLI